MEALAVRVLGGQRLELGDQLAVAAELEVELDAVLERGEAQLVEPVGLAAGGPVERRVGQRRPAELAQRLAQQLGRLVGRRVARLRDQRLEAREVERCRDRAGSRSRTARVTIGFSGAERPPQLGDVDLQRLASAVGGGSSSHRTSISRALETASSRYESRSIASSARCFGALISIAPSGPPTRSGPRIAKSIAAALYRPAASRSALPRQRTR